MATERPDLLGEEVAAKELVNLAREQGLSWTGPDGRLRQFTEGVLETAVNEGMTEHLGHEKSQVPPGRESTNVRSGARRTSVPTGASDTVDLEVPRDRDGTFEPLIVTKRQRQRQRRLGEVDEIVLSL